MGEDYKSCFSQPHSDWRLPKLNSLADLLNLELVQDNGASGCMGSNANLISTPPTSVPYMQASETTPDGWFYCFPHHQQTFAPAPSSGIMTQPPTSPYNDLRQVTAHNAGSKSSQKRYIVFDQSGDQKSLFVSSFTAFPTVQPLDSWSPTNCEAYNLSLEDSGNKAPTSRVVPTLIGDINENNGADAGSGLHEDTEELDALLYSDDSDDTEDSDEKSTGHSPSTMTDHDNSEWMEGGSTEEVDSSGRVTNLKRRKLGDSSYEVALFKDSVGSHKPNPYVESDGDDAESSCADSVNLGKVPSFAGNKRMRNKKIRETVSVLQSIIPLRKGGNVVVILDEAIQYLKSLKRRAKALGLN